MRLDTQNSVMARVKRQYPIDTLDPKSPMRCAACRLNAFDVVFVATQVVCADPTCCKMAERVNR
jgi:hypothetical protein